MHTEAHRDGLHMQRASLRSEEEKMESDFRRIYNFAVKEKDKAGFTWNPAAVSAMIQYILREKDIRAEILELRKSRLDRLIELKAPEFIVENERALVTKAEIELQVFGCLENYLLTADKAAEEEILWQPVIEQDVTRIKDAVSAALSPRCRHCINSVLENNIWVCNLTGNAIDLEESTPEEGCTFVLDDVAMTDYRNFIEKYPGWGAKVRKDEDEFNEKVELAIASHHAVLTDRVLESVLSEKEKQELESGLEG